MPLALDDKWIWDSWYAHDGQRWHGYFLQADKSLGDPDLRHFNVSQGHAVSDDLMNWEHKGTCLAPAPKPAWDDTTTWTGSVIEGPDGVWHLFYTGGGSAEKGLYQRIGHATSTDMHAWERVGSGLCLDMEGPNAAHYEAEHAVGHWHDRAMRDPFVMKDPEGDGYLMYFTARAPGIDEPNAGGAIGFATSPDLYEWTLQPPVFTGDYGQLEVPQVFRIGSSWYCLFCTADEHWSEARKARAGTPPVTGNHYLMADDVRGPWVVAPGFLDGDLPCYRYAARVLETEDGHVLMGFADGGKDRFGGYVMDPVPLKVDARGLLYIEPSDRGK
ncbi:levansucrase [Limimaricola sp.]|uniref:levansucrase n=1 Tax=Limimaricola sp. TaxID=2211665 RepID=UPI00405812FB